MKTKVILFTAFVCLLVGGMCSSGCNGPKTETETETETETVDTLPSIKPIINIYIENSGSMNGYVNGGTTEFQQALYSYLSNIQNSDISDSVRLFYINKQILPQDNNIKSFIRDLTPASFKKKGGNLGSTDMAELFETLLEQTSDTTISILISDCIISPGKGINAEEYLVNQQIGIKNGFVRKLKVQPNLSVVFYRLQSSFSGAYYNRVNSITHINNLRPYFICLLGNNDLLKQLISNKEANINDIKGNGVENYCTLFKGNANIDYAIQRDPKHGTFELDKRQPKSNIIKAKSERKGSTNYFMFTVGIDYSNSLLNHDYLTNTNNYSLNDKNYSIDKITTKQNNKYSHFLQIKTDIVKPTSLRINLINTIPDWVSELNDDDDTNILASGSMEKTYGIKYVIGGVYDAFTVGNKTYSEIIININK